MIRFNLDRIMVWRLAAWYGAVCAIALDGASAHLIRLVPDVTIATPFACFIAMASIAIQSGLSYL